MQFTIRCDLLESYSNYIREAKNTVQYYNS